MSVTPAVTANATSSRLLIRMLWILWAAFLFGGYIFGEPAGESDRRMPTWTRLASSIVLVAAGWTFFNAARNTRGQTFAFWIAAGMTLGFIGDVFMAQLLASPTNSVLGGMTAFGIGHILYITACLHVARLAGLNNAKARFGALAAWWAVAAIGWFLAVARGNDMTVLHWAALPYSLLLAGTAGFAAGLALQAKPFCWTAAGAALFLFSDLVIAVNMFAADGPRVSGDLVWLTYGPGQMLIVFSLAPILRWLTESEPTALQ
jgi:hypothetical protein